MLSSHILDGILGMCLAGHLPGRISAPDSQPKAKAGICQRTEASKAGRSPVRTDAVHASDRGGIIANGEPSHVHITLRRQAGWYGISGENTPISWKDQPPRPHVLVILVRGEEDPPDVATSIGSVKCFVCDRQLQVVRCGSYGDDPAAAERERVIANTHGNCSDHRVVPISPTEQPYE